MARVQALTIENYRSISGPLTIKFPVGCPVVLIGENEFTTDITQLAAPQQLTYHPYEYVMSIYLWIWERNIAWVRVVRRTSLKTARESSLKRLSVAFWITLLCACGQAAPTSQRPGAASESWLVIDNATVIEPLRQQANPGTRIIIRNDRITCVGRNDVCRAPEGARHIDASQRWVIPGLIDAHVHLSEERGNFGPLYLAFGITSVRDLGGYPDTLKALRARIEAGDELGPRIFFAGRPVDGSPTIWPRFYPDVPRVARDTAEARAAVRQAIAEGSAFIKLYGALTTDQVRAAASEAHVRGLKATIDASNLHPDSLLAAGVDGFEHRVPAVQPPGLPTRMEWAINRNGIDSALTVMRTRGVALTSTMVLFDRLQSGALPLAEPTYRALPELLKERSARMLADAPPLDSARRATLRRNYNYYCETVRLFAAKGGLLMAGTDSYYLSVYPGDLHRELELLVSCGASAWQALAAATRNPMDWLAADSLGRIAVNALADMLVLQADPSRDIRNTREIEFVIKNGRIHRPEEILRTVR